MARYPIISMGDYNDEPYDRAMQQYGLGTRDPGRVRYSRSGHLLNLMWPLMQGHDPGTYLFGSDWNMLDQISGQLRRCCAVPAGCGSRRSRPASFARPRWWDEAASRVALTALRPSPVSILTVTPTTFRF